MKKTIEETHPSLSRASILAIQEGQDVTFKDLVQKHTVDKQKIRECVDRLATAPPEFGEVDVHKVVEIVSYYVDEMYRLLDK
jgi:hypothetical protein